MHPNAELLKTFYDAFARKDTDTMRSCYADNATFSDPVFPALNGTDIGDMWTMLCERGKDLTLVSSGIEADDNTGKAHWEATYTFAKTGRKVHNVIDAQFQFKDGKIVSHTDHFPFYKWSRMALGMPGVLLGWTPVIANKVRSEAAKGLGQWQAKQTG